MNEWFTSTRQQAYQSVDTVIAAIWECAAMRVWRALEDVLARELEHRLAGLAPKVMHIDGPVAKREVHVRDSVRSDEYPWGRVIIARMYEFGPDGPLHILDRGGGMLSRETVTRSNWMVCGGWIVNGPRSWGSKRPGPSGNGAADENTPPPTIKP